MPKSHIMMVNVTTMSDNYGQRFTDAIRREYAPLRNAKKRVAALADASTRAAETWLSGEHTPSLTAAIMLAARCPKSRAALMDLIEEAAACSHSK